MELLRYVALALLLVAVANTAYGQDYNNRIGVDVTPKAQLEINRENAKREAIERQSAEARAEQARQRAAQLERERIQAQAAAEAARVKAQGEVEAAKMRKPDVCLNCTLLR